MGDLHWIIEGQPLSREPIGLAGLSATRPLIEDRIRRRVAALPGVEFVTGVRVVAARLS
ncbi:hypothetical protein [Micromonospora sp. NPDC048898]|uniref:hypothetical protein n=1 Tax=Micromonospora sp. NPDC048898 TaxID=3364260 RepID=UPI0037102457